MYKLVDWERERDSDEVLDCWDEKCLSERCVESGKRCVVKMEKGIKSKCSKCGDEIENGGLRLFLDEEKKEMVCNKCWKKELMKRMERR